MLFCTTKHFRCFRSLELDWFCHLIMCQNLKKLLTTFTLICFILGSSILQIQWQRHFVVVFVCCCFFFCFFVVVVAFFVLFNLVCFIFNFFDYTNTMATPFFSSFSERYFVLFGPVYGSHMSKINCYCKVLISVQIETF